MQLWHRISIPLSQYMAANTKERVEGRRAKQQIVVGWLGRSLRSEDLSNLSRKANVQMP